LPGSDPEPEDRAAAGRGCALPGPGREQRAGPSHDRGVPQAASGRVVRAGLAPVPGDGIGETGHVALDGTKLKADASKHMAMSCERMTREESRLTAEVQALLSQAEATDEREDAKYGLDKRGDELPAELAFREGRLKKIREARSTSEREAREEAKKREESHHAGVGGEEDVPPGL
jgi:hypothetical protein